MVKFRILTFIISLIFCLPLAQAQNEDECLVLTLSENIPPDILNAASNIMVGYRSTQAFEPIRILNSDSSASPIRLPYREEGLIGSYTVVELSPDHQKILQIFLDDTNEMTLRISSLVDDRVVSTEIDGITDPGRSPRWMNPQTILLDRTVTDESVYSYTILSVEDTRIETMVFDLSSQRISVVDPQLSPDVSNLLLHDRENNSGRIYIYSGLAQISTPISNSDAEVRHLQWSPQGNYISFLHDFNPDSFVYQKATILSRSGELVTTRKLYFGDPVVFPRIEEIIWSYDERFIAYQHGVSHLRGQTGSKTTVMNIESREIVDICIPGNLFWSPNSQYAAMFLRTPRSSSPPNVVLALFVIDMNSHEIYEIPIGNMDDIALEVGWFDPISND